MFHLRLVYANALLATLVFFLCDPLARNDDYISL